MVMPLDAIADPVRLRIVRRLADGSAAGVPELAAAAQVHANTVRPHLAALEEAGILSRDRAAPAGRGQPPVRWRLAPGFTLPTADFRGLAELLATAVLRGARKPDELRALGLEWGRFLLGRPGAHAIADELPLALEGLGFGARLAKGKLILTACPCPVVLPDRPDMICRLTLAVVDGFLAGAGSPLRVVESEHDPARRSCTACLRAPER